MNLNICNICLTDFANNFNKTCQSALDMILQFKRQYPLIQ